jgi:CHAD domain-containing protein
VDPGELLFGAGTDPGQVSAALSRRYRLHVAPPATASWTCLDTADWRLHRRGLTLREARQGRSRRLVLSDGRAGPLSAPSPVRSWPRRIDTLPASPIRDRIAPAVGVRALLPLAEVGVRALDVRVLDDEDKIRVRLRVEQQRLVGDRPTPLPLRVLVSPLRGYERDGRRCAELLADAMTPLAGVDGATTAALLAAGHQPGDSPSAVELDPDASARNSLAEVLRRWIDIIDAVRPGVLADVDPEYLHELRTSVRATRSLLRISGDLVADAPLSRFAADFAWLGHVTAPLRDLDVQLLELAGSGDTDVSGLAGLEPLQRQLAAQRRRALTTVRSLLQSPRATTLSANWRTALDAFAESELPSPTTGAAASAHAAEAYRRIVRAAAPVTADTHPDELHRLRRLCKRMRYLLDGYATVYAREPHRDVLAALKALQDCLGDIQDVDVQRRQLGELAETLNRRGVPAQTLLATGALRDRILARDAAARRTLARRLARFCAPRTRASVAALGTVGTVATVGA